MLVAQELRGTCRDVDEGKRYALSSLPLPKSPLRTGRTQASLCFSVAVTERLVAGKHCLEIADTVASNYLSPRPDLLGCDMFRAKIF
ncbi:MAG: hypothetical protein HC765_03055 [Brachymonas sp.]|nr:hypothetical protein [Brachymonas sp.]